MNRFAIAQPRSFDEACELLGNGRFSLPVLKAGGMDVLDHLKEGLIEPDALIDIRKVKRDNQPQRISIDRRPRGGTVATIEAGATLAEIAASEPLSELAPVVGQAVGSAAAPHIRNIATAAGNLLQRPRCWYYRNSEFDCLKKGGYMCFAVEGENRYHAVFGEGPCHIVHPSNLAPALYVCRGVVHLIGGDRDSLPVSQLYHEPEAGIRSEHNLRPNEIITHVSFPSAMISGFYAVKEKQSFDWPLVMAAVALHMEGRRIASARVCAGAVAPVPWPLPNVENALRGVRIDDEAALKHACARAVEGAAPMSDNSYKLKLLPVAIRRAIMTAVKPIAEDEQ